LENREAIGLIALKVFILEDTYACRRTWQGIKEAQDQLDMRTEQATQPKADFNRGRSYPCQAGSLRIITWRRRYGKMIDRGLEHAFQKLKGVVEFNRF
jgi:hypothetical protein